MKYTLTTEERNFVQTVLDKFLTDFEPVNFTGTSISPYNLREVSFPDMHAAAVCALSESGYFEIVSDHPYPGRKYMLAWRYLCGKTYR